VEIFYAKRLIRGATDMKKRPLPDCVLVSAFPSKNNRDKYLERHTHVKIADPDEPLVLRAKQAGLRDDYHSVSLPISVLKEIAGATANQKAAKEEPAIEPASVKADDETKELPAPIKRKKRKYKRKAKKVVEG